MSGTRADSAGSRSHHGLGSEILAVLEPAEMKCSRTPGGLLRVQIGSQGFVGATVRQAFPRSAPGRFLLLTDAAGKDIGILDDQAALDPESRAAVSGALRVHYLIPIIIRVTRVRQDPGSWTFEADTDRGPVRLPAPQSARPSGDGRRRPPLHHRRQRAHLRDSVHCRS